MIDNNRSKKIICIVIPILVVLAFSIFLLLTSNSADRSYDFIDNFSKVSHYLKETDVQPTDEIINRRLAESVNPPLPQKLREAVSRFLSYGARFLVKSGKPVSEINTVNISGPVAIYLTLPVKDALRNNSASNMAKKSAKSNKPETTVHKSSNYATDYRLSITTDRDESRYIFEFDCVSKIVGIFHEHNGVFNTIDKVYAYRADGKLRIFILFLKDRVMIYTAQSVLSHFKIDEKIPGAVRFTAVGNNRISDVETVRIKTIPPEFLDTLKKTIFRNQLSPVDEPAKEYELWNEFKSEDRIFGYEGKSEYIRRLKLGDHSRRAILLTRHDGFTFKDVLMPERGIFEAAVAAHPNFTASDAEVRFVMRLFDDEGESVKRFTSRVDTSAEGIGAWKQIKYDLSEFGSQTLKVAFELEIKDEEPSAERPVVVALGNPVVRATREEDDINVILISLDTLRADHMGCLGYHRDTSPGMDRWAKKVTFFKNCIANSSWTLPSHLSIFTSLYPQEVGVEACANVEHINRSRLAEGIPTMATYLKFAGYKTCAITGGGYISAVFGFDRGFQVYKEYPGRKNIKLDVNEALEFIQKNRDYKFFLFLHTFEIHAPYRRRHYKPLGTSNKERIIADYDSGIRYSDRQVSRFLKRLKKLGLYEKSVIIITSDHGERFDHITEKSKFGTHGHTLYDSVLRVPLLIGGVEDFSGGKVIDAIVSGVDIMPTVLDYLDIDYPSNYLRGRSLLPLLNENNENNRRAYSANILGGKRDLESLRSIEYKLIRHFDVKSGDELKNLAEFYNLIEDRGEEHNINTNPQKKLFYNKAEQLRKTILERYRKIKKRTGVDVKYKKLIEALEIGGYVSPKK